MLLSLQSYDTFQNYVRVEEWDACIPDMLLLSSRRSDANINVYFKFERIFFREC